MHNKQTFAVYRLTKSNAYKANEINNLGWDQALKSEDDIVRYHALKALKNESEEFRDICCKLQSSNILTHVANVTCSDIDQAFVLTNNINKSWIDNKEVELLVDRDEHVFWSSYPGDLFIDENETYFIVEPVGFKVFTPVLECA